MNNANGKYRSFRVSGFLGRLYYYHSYSLKECVIHISQFAKLLEVYQHWKMFGLAQNGMPFISTRKKVFKRHSKFKIFMWHSDGIIQTEWADYVYYVLNTLNMAQYSPFFVILYRACKMQTKYIPLLCSEYHSFIVYCTGLVCGAREWRDGKGAKPKNWMFWLNISFYNDVKRSWIAMENGTLRYSKSKNGECE